MGHFADEPHSLQRLKWILLTLGTVAVGLFALEYITAWVYPIVSVSYNKFVLMHILHLLLITGTIIIKNAMVQTPAFGVYIGTYVTCALMDLAGCITRTIYFHQSRLSITSFEYIFGLILLVMEWSFPVIAVIQVMITTKIAELTSNYLELQDYIVITLTLRNDTEPVDDTTKAWLEEYKEKLGLKLLKPEQQQQQGKKPKTVSKRVKSDENKKNQILKGISDKVRN